MHHNNHWEEELKKESLKETPLKPKSQWLKPLTIYHSLEFKGKLTNLIKGLDERDFYKAPEYDAWDYQAWNVLSRNRIIPKCNNYYLDLQKCQHYLKAEFPHVKTSFLNRRNYCWKIHDNYNNCIRTLYIYFIYDNLA